jgi:hypothetical protein
MKVITNSTHEIQTHRPRRLDQHRSRRSSLALNENGSLTIFHLSEPMTV